MSKAPRRLLATLAAADLEPGATVSTCGLVVHNGGSDGIRAAKNRCRHMGGTFRKEDGHSCKMRCARHGWTLDASTMRYENPQGGLVQPELEVEQRDGHVLVYERAQPRPWTERMPRETLSRGELVVKYMSHACVEIRCGDLTVMTDPWLMGPAFARGWWLAHDPPPDALARLAKASCIYISHDHSDHLNEHTLRELVRIRRDAPIVVPAFESGRCERLLLQLGFTHVTSLPLGEWRWLGDKTRIMILGDGAGREDSALLVEHKGHTVLDTVDCMNPNDGDLPEVDVLLTQFAGGATGYPVCWEDLYGEKRIAEIVQRNLAQARKYVLDLVAAAKPRAWMPIAGYFREAHPAETIVGARNVKNDPDRIAEAIHKRFPNVRTHRAIPDAAIDAACPEERDVKYGKTAPPPRHDFEPYVDAIRRSADFGPLDTLHGLQSYFDWAGFRGDLVLHVVETNEDFTQNLREFFVDFRTGTVSFARPLSWSRYERMRVRSDVLRHVLRRGASWEEISIGFQARFFREPDVYNMDLWMHFQHALPATPPFREAA